jgi:hypothetical protein
MKASKFSDAQKAFILKQGADGMPVADICRRPGSARRPTSGSPRTSYKRDLPNAGALRLSARSCDAAARGLVARTEQDPPRLSRIRPAITH